MRRLLLLAVMWFPPPTRAQTGLDSQWIAFNRASAPNSNLQCFRPNNVTVLDGNLVITTKRERAICSSIDLSLAAYRYTSGWVSMRNFHFLYGTVEFRAKFGGGMNTGAWPVVWMADTSCQASDPTGTDDNCNGQEIDIAEILSGDFTHVNQQIHVESFSHNDGCRASTTDTSKNFHVYQLLWSAGSLVFKIDGATTCTINEKYVPDAPMYVKINNFVGKFGGPVNDRSLPWVTLVDYVKVTQNSKVIFEDDFDPKDTNRRPKAVFVTSSSDNQSNKTPFKSSWRWPVWALVIGLAILFTRSVFRSSFADGACHWWAPPDSDDPGGDMRRDTETFLQVIGVFLGLGTARTLLASGWYAQKEPLDRNATSVFAKTLSE